MFQQQNILPALTHFPIIYRIYIIQYYIWPFQSGKICLLYRTSLWLNTGSILFAASSWLNAYLCGFWAYTLHTFIIGLTIQYYNDLFYLLYFLLDSSFLKVQNFYFQFCILSTEHQAWAFKKCLFNRNEWICALQ